MVKRSIKFGALSLAAFLGLSLSNIAYSADVKKLTDTCASCHGKAGASTEPDVPIIGGYSEEFLVNNMNAYKNKERACPETEFKTGSKKGTKTDMCKMVKDLSEGDIRQIAQYFAKQKFVRAKQKFDPELAKKGKEIHDMYCEKCHSEGGTVSTDDSGMPAGQWTPYLRHAFEEFNTGKRPIAKKMKLKMDELTKSDIEALLNYYASINK